MLLYSVEWHPGMVGVPISDEDLTSQTVNGWKRLNTLAHYSIQNMSIMKLVPKYQAQSLHSDSMYTVFCDALISYFLIFSYLFTFYKREQRYR